MKKIIVFLFVVLGIALYGYSLKNEEEKEVIYVSSSMGDDSNPGTKDKPLKSISAVPYKSNVHIYLKRGDIFFERIYNFKNSIIEAYGSGEKPILCGFRILKNTKAWIKVNGNVWKLDMSQNENFTGFLRTSATSDKTFHNIGMIYDIGRDQIYGNMVESLSKLRENGDFFVSSSFKKEKEDRDSFRWLYFYYDKDPNLLEDLCISVGEKGINKIEECKISNLSIVGFGIHGAALSSGTIFDSCDIDLIGGSLHTKSKFLRLGNGIEIWIPKGEIVHDVLVENCQITRTYDTGTTIQGTQTMGSKARNIHFVNNRIAYCRQAFERYLNPIESDAYYENCSFHNNYVYMSGHNQFGIKKRENDVHLLSYEKKPKKIDIYDNVFFGGNFQFSSVFTGGIRTNTIYIYKGEFLLSKPGEMNKIFASDKNALMKYKSISMDESNVILLEKESEKDEKLRLAFKDKVLLHYPILHKKELK